MTHPQYPCDPRLLAKFPRNLAPAFTHYLSERPEMKFSMTRVHGKPNKERKIKHMKNRNNIFTTTLVALAFALALGAEASPAPDGGPTYLFSTASSNANSDGENSDGENLPMITIHSTDNVIRGKTGSFVLNM